MVRVTEELALSPEHVTLYHASDPLLGHLPVLLFHGASTTANYTHNSSRVQMHIFSPAGFQSFPRVTISPNSPFYGVVNQLPREFQGDEICRALAFGLYKYFKELPDGVKTHLRNHFPTTKARRPGSAPALFGEQHAADLAKAMVQAENTADVIKVLQAALRTQHVSGLDMDLVLPPGAIIPLGDEDLEDVPDEEDDILDPTLRMYGGYTPLIKLFGEPVFMATSRMRRAPSRPTSLNRSKSFSKDQKVELRMKMGELVETEERYVAKLNELVNTMAVEFRRSAKERPTGSTSPSVEDVDKLFPASAAEMLRINTAFMWELRRVMDESEQDAVRDMELSFPTVRLGGPGKVKDASGALAMARVFVEWFPKFTDCYQDYIRASQHFPPLLNSFLDQQSSFRQRVAQHGEQMLRSILIEPVQRLPRYSLFIDQMVSCLPMTHPALQLMLKARDIITNICSMDDPLPDKPHVTSRLRSMVECWPPDLEPQGRLIVAVDVAEIPVPYTSVSPEGSRFLLLLFSDCVAVLKKTSKVHLTGRDFLRELDKPSPAGLLASMTNAAGGPGSWEFSFTSCQGLADVRFTESDDGRVIWMASKRDLRCFLLQEAYEGKAGRWAEDVIKARIEGRFAEAERENATWTLRSVPRQDNNLALHAAVFQEAAEDLVEGRREPASVRVVLDTDKGTKSAPVGHYGVEVVVEVRCGDMKRIAMETSGLNGQRYSDDVALEDFLPSLTRRIVQLTVSQFSVANPRLTLALVSYYTGILRAVGVSSIKTEKPKSFLSTSPVKMLSSFLGGGTTSVAETRLHGPKFQRTPVASLWSSTHMPRSNTQPNLAACMKDSPVEDGQPENPLVRLEQTFTGYVASLHARKGYFIARNLLNRDCADELLVNDLYNRLIESPYDDVDASADVGAEVVFAAFEKFVRMAWREQMGPIMTRQALEALQVRASKRVPGDFADFVNYLFGDMAPQNRRAFTALIKLLADLLDGCGNDGDRGALTVAFAELLVDDGGGQNYINLLDRLVEDCDRIFDDGAGFGQVKNSSSSLYDSVSSMARHSHKSASMTSNTSSLRRKFGLESLLRQNNKIADSSNSNNTNNNNNNNSTSTYSNDEHRTSVWRSLSKHGRNPATGEPSSSSSSSSMSKASSVGRSRSIDVPPAGKRRPGSRDRPPVAGAFDEVMYARPASSHRLETIGEPGETSGVVAGPASTLKKQRRSSLSDLKTLMAAASLHDADEAVVEKAGKKLQPSPMPLMPLRINKQQTAAKFNSSPRIPVAASRMPPPSPASPQALRSPRQKENAGGLVSCEDAYPTKITSPPVGKSSFGHGKGLSTSNIPTLKASRLPTSSGGSGAVESPTRRPSSSPSKPTVSAAATAQKLRLQSPQKLRERLLVEKKAAADVDAALRTELSKITEDMARVGTEGGADLRRAVADLESRLPRELDELRTQHTATLRDTEATLRAAEAKVRAIDQLYKEATAENELLYEKFNNELTRMVQALKGKGREDKEELVTRARDAGEEAARLRRDNARLRRDMVNLRALLRGGESG